MNWQKLKERLAEVAVILGGLVVLGVICLVIFSVGLFANNVLHAVNTVNAQGACPK